MHRAHGEAGIRTRMTLAAGLNKIRFMHRGGRIEVRFDRVHAVTARTIHDLNRTTAGRQTVVTIRKRLERIRGQPVFLRQPQRGMTARANLLRNVAGVDRRG